MLLTNEQPKSCQNAKICYNCKEKFEDKYAKDKRNCIAKDHYYHTGNIEALHVAYLI